MSAEIVCRSAGAPTKTHISHTYIESYIERPTPPFIAGYSRERLERDGERELLFLAC